MPISSFRDNTLETVEDPDSKLVRLRLNGRPVFSAASQVDLKKELEGSGGESTINLLVNGYQVQPETARRLVRALAARL